MEGVIVASHHVMTQVQEQKSEMSHRWAHFGRNTLIGQFCTVFRALAAGRTENRRGNWSLLCCGILSLLIPTTEPHSRVL
jgi:hypothetical protein